MLTFSPTRPIFQRAVIPMAGEENSYQERAAECVASLLAIFRKKSALPVVEIRPSAIRTREANPGVLPVQTNPEPRLRQRRPCPLWRAQRVTQVNASQPTPGTERPFEPICRPARKTGVRCWNPPTRNGVSGWCVPKLEFGNDSERIGSKEGWYGPMRGNLLDTNHLRQAIGVVSPLRERLRQAHRQGSRRITCWPVLCELQEGIVFTADPGQ